MAKIGKIIKVAGPHVVAENMSGAKMFDIVHVSDKRLMGEIIEFKRDLASIQVYEETGGIGVGEPVYPAGEPLTVELGPGVIASIYDGIQRPLDEIYENSGDYISRGVTAAALDRKKKWD
ncbi:MAG: V-type ATP synthase subunit A, partial [Actinomycetota bacterium]